MTSINPKRAQQYLDNDTSSTTQPPLKRQRPVIVAGSSSSCSSCSTLSELFERRKPIDDVNDDPSSSRSQRLGSSSSSSSTTTTDDDNFFTLRLEHRSNAGPKNEERILIFRSDRPGVIGKIIYTSCRGRSTSRTKKTEAIAKIVVLDVKGVYRGRDLGGLLFHEALVRLKRRYMDEDCRCDLDAEEDLSRYNKLIHFYEELGCHVKPKAKVRFLNNNDGEMYRSVPMQIQIAIKTDSSHHDTRDRIDSSDTCESSLLNSNSGSSFLPVQLLGPNGQSLIINASHRKLGWLIVQNANASVSFRTTQGHSLLATPEGKLILSSSSQLKEMHNMVHECECFRPFRNTDNPQSATDSNSNNEEEEKESSLWLFQTSQGMYLGMNSQTMHLTCSSQPTFWKVNSNALTLTCTRDTPLRQLHYRNAWLKQSVQYVTTMRSQYCNFDRARMTIRQAMNLLKHVNHYPFIVEGRTALPSVRTFCFKFAEAVRQKGHPDWIQLVALVAELGRVLKHLDHPNENTTPPSPTRRRHDYDWTLTSTSRVVGCLPSRTSPFSAQYRHLNPDSHNPSYNTPRGPYPDNCGFERLLLAWTGPEYVYHMLRRNDTAVPWEGLDVLRYFMLTDWHGEGYYAGSFATEREVEVRDVVVDFYELRRSVNDGLLETRCELSDEECDELWDKFYEDILCKYACDGILHW